MQQQQQQQQQQQLLLEQWKSRATRVAGSFCLVLFGVCRASAERPNVSMRTMFVNSDYHNRTPTHSPKHSLAISLGSHQKAQKAPAGWLAGWL